MKILLIRMLWMVVLNLCLYILNAQDINTSELTLDPTISELQTSEDSSVFEASGNDTTFRAQLDSNTEISEGSVKESIADTLEKAENISADLKKDQPIAILHFYQKWWFTLLILIFASPLLFRYFNKNKTQQIVIIDELNKEINSLKTIVKEKEDDLQKTQNETKSKLNEEQELKFQAFGLSKFSQIITNNRNDLNKLGHEIISELVNYIGANSGIIYTVSDDEQLLEILSAYAPDSEKVKQKIHIGEGYVGTCFNDGAILELENVPDGYSKLESGLGKASQKYIAFVPLMQDDIKLGVIEIGSFEKFEKYKLEFIEKLSQNIASTIVIKRANYKMEQLLERTQQDAEELRAQEEEMRQNMEEMLATQEELNRQMEENKKIQNDLLIENTYLDALMNNLPEYIYFKDLDSKFLKNTKSLANMFGLENANDLIGKCDFDFFDDEHARPAFEDEQKIIKTGKPILNLVEKEVKKDGSISWVNTSKLPLITGDGKIIGTFGISKDISAQMKVEMEIKERNEELLAQEEELRQNLEEMQTIQDELAKEKYLMDALMDNLPEFIYFKDLESKFIKNSKSHAKIFGFEDATAILGKSDFDFFGDEHARPAFEDEQKIIKTGKPIINLVEKEVKKDGSVTWVTTTKLPLKDQSGKTVGTFGISKDITEQMKAETELKERNEELLAQEEELKQNLEEMQTIQDELAKEKYLMDALMENLPEFIYFKDRESKFIKNSKSHAKIFGFEDATAILGKSDFDFFGDEHARPAFEDEQKIIKTGKPIINLVEREVKKDGSVTWVTTTKLPLKDQSGKTVGTFGISKDITEQMKAETELKERNEELLAQEEELKQNLEEMQTIQEDLQKQIKEKEILKLEFERKEKVLKDEISKYKK